MRPGLFFILFANDLAHPSALIIAYLQDSWSLIYSIYYSLTYWRPTPIPQHTYPVTSI